MVRVTLRVRDKAVVGIEIRQIEIPRNEKKPVLGPSV